MKLREMGVRVEDFGALFAYSPITTHPQLTNWAPTKEYREARFEEVGMERLMKEEPTLNKLMDRELGVKDGRLVELLQYAMECARMNGAEVVENPLLNLSLPPIREEQDLVEKGARIGEREETEKKKKSTLLTISQMNPILGSNNARLTSPNSEREKERREGLIHFFTESLPFLTSSFTFSSRAGKRCETKCSR